ncbi:MAG: TraB/GumN family protein [Caulobacteraceae bacterium]|nr:TraB/GumN family protein [Caulobacteraceae bacterium]
MARRLVFLLLLALLALPTTVGAANAPGATSGPAWWRISDRGGSTLWILAVPDGMMMDVKWDDAVLRTRLKTARQVLSPWLGKPPGMTAPSIGVRGAPEFHFSLPTDPNRAYQYKAPEPAAYWAEIGDNPAYMGELVSKVVWGDPLTKRLPADLLSRVDRRLAELRLDPKLSSELHNAPTFSVALWLDVWSWPKGLLGNPVTERAQTLAATARVPIKRMDIHPLWAPVLIDSSAPDTHLWDSRVVSGLLVPPETLQQTCLKKALDEHDQGITQARVAAMEAWASGDVPNALKRSGDIQLCLMVDQPSFDVASFWLKQATAYQAHLDTAFDAPGETVAIVEFDPLLVPGGILDHYRRLGYEVISP